VYPVTLSIVFYVLLLCCDSFAKCGLASKKRLVKRRFQQNARIASNASIRVVMRALREIYNECIVSKMFCRRHKLDTLVAVPKDTSALVTCTLHLGHHQPKHQVNGHHQALSPAGSRHLQAVTLGLH